MQYMAVKEPELLQRSLSKTGAPNQTKRVTSQKSWNTALVSLTDSFVSRNIAYCHTKHKDSFQALRRDNFVHKRHKALLEVGNELHSNANLCAA